MKWKSQCTALAAIVAISVGWLAGPSVPAYGGGQRSVLATNPPPSSEEIRTLIERTVENQHRNDRAVEEFERVERVVTMKPGDPSNSISDRTDRILPSGSGVMKLQVAENGTPVSPDLYRRELQFAVSALDLAIHPNDRYRQDLAKFEKRKRERAEFEDTGKKAFHVTWAGRETRANPVAGRSPQTLDKFILEPDPNYRPGNRLAASFEHVRATIWVDESQSQFARLEGDITSDITFAAGIAGKVYHGGHFVMEQAEMAPGIWLPTLYTYNVDGRKFLFGFGVHERTEISQYRRVGPPQQSIELIRNELNNLEAGAPAH